MAAPAGSLTLRSMTGPDIATASVLSREQAWPHREEDWALFLDAGEGIVAERAGRVLGTVMAWRYGEDFATVGMVIVASDVQGQGVGRKLMEAMLDCLAGRTVVLNATAANQFTSGGLRQDHGPWPKPPTRSRHLRPRHRRAGSGMT